MLGVPDERAMRGGCDYSRQCLLQQRPTGVTAHLDQSQRRFPVPVKDRFVFPTLIISIETNWVFGLKLMIPRKTHGNLRAYMAVCCCALMNVYRIRLRFSMEPPRVPNLDELRMLFRS
jgi:hypothetical protein